MVLAFRITINSRNAQNVLSNVSVNIPNECAEAGHDLIKLMQRNMRYEVTRQGLVWRGKLWNGIQARRKSKNRSELVVPSYGVSLDSMNPHMVKLKKGRLIRLWAMQKGNSYLKQVAKRQGSIMVHPHPWIDKSMVGSLERFPDILKRRADKAMRESEQNAISS